VRPGYELARGALLRQIDFAKACPASAIAFL